MINLIRYIIPFIAPLPIAIFLLIIGLVCLIGRKNRAAISFNMLGIGIILFFGYGIVTHEELFKLERESTPFSAEKLAPEIKEKIQYIVVLGSGHVSDPFIPLSSRIGSASLYRLIEGIIIQRELAGAKLIISGGLALDPIPNAEIVGKIAREIGVDEGDMILEKRPSDTIEEARLLQPLLGNNPFILVTSAAHMQRALKLFRDVGTQPIPAPTDYILKNKQGITSEIWVPSCLNLSISQRVIYEKMGWLWLKMKQISF